MGEMKLESHPEYVSLSFIEQRYAVKKSTMYDWKCRPARYDVPDGMMKKFGRSVRVNLVVFENWFQNRNG